MRSLWDFGCHLFSGFAAGGVVPWKSIDPLRTSISYTFSLSLAFSVSECDFFLCDGQVVCLLGGILLFSIGSFNWLFNDKCEDIEDVCFSHCV